MLELAKKNFNIPITNKFKHLKEMMVVVSNNRQKLSVRREIGTEKTKRKILEVKYTISEMKDWTRSTYWQIGDDTRQISKN